MLSRTQTEDAHTRPHTHTHTKTTKLKQRGRLEWLGSGERPGFTPPHILARIDFSFSAGMDLPRNWSTETLQLHPTSDSSVL
jgi:hypothetical protein